jgi:hypothetical protein
VILLSISLFGGGRGIRKVLEAQLMRVGGHGKKNEWRKGGKGRN